MNHWPLWAGCGYGYGRQAASTYKQYVCFAFLRNLVLAAPKSAIYSFASPYLLNAGGTSDRTASMTVSSASGARRVGWP